MPAVVTDVAGPREPLDVRLAVGAAAGWLAVLGCVHHSPGAVLGIAVSAALGGVVAVLGAGRFAGAAALALVLFCVALVLLPLSGRIARARASPLVTLAREHAAVTAALTVDADPRVLAATGPAGSSRVAVEASADAVLVRGRTVPVGGDVLVLGEAAAWQDVLPGQHVRVAGDLQPALGGGALSVTLFERSPPALIGAPPWWQRAAGRVRASLRTASSGLPDQVRGLLPGLIDGDTAGLDPVLAERFRLAGLTHLVAVSGTNCSIVVGAVLLVLRRARARPWACATAGALVLLMFVVVARPSPSVLRAAVMSAIALVSLASGRPRSALPGLSAAVIVLLLWDPTLAASASFAMSVLATAALLVLAPGGRGRCVRVACHSASPKPSQSRPRHMSSQRRWSPRSRAGSVSSRFRRTSWPSRSSRSRPSSGSRLRSSRRCGWGPGHCWPGRRAGRAGGWWSWPTSSAACTGRRWRGPGERPVACCSRSPGWAWLWSRCGPARAASWPPPRRRRC